MVDKLLNGEQGEFKQPNIMVQLIFPFICIGFMTYYYFNTRDLHYYSLAFPRILMILLVVTLAWDILGTVLEGRKASTVQGKEKHQHWLKSNFRGIVVYLSTIIYVILLSILGYGLSTLLYITLMVYYLGIRKFKNISFYVFISFMFLYGVFVLLLKVRLPSGIFF